MECRCCCDGEGVVECRECAYSVCQKCADRYWSEKGKMECMKCGAPWDICAVMDEMPGYIYGEAYRKWRTRWLVAREERGMAAAAVRARELSQKASIMERIRQLEEELASCREALKKESKGQNRRAAAHCRDGSCGGFQDESGECMACRTRYCVSCQEPEHGLTPCLEEKKRDIDLVRSVSKPCPGCHVPIQKSSGCYQMWCTRCRTGFDWNTGAVIATNLHNPHFFESKVAWADIAGIIPADKTRLWRPFCRFLNDIGSPRSDEDDDRRLEEWRIERVQGRLTREEWEEKLFRHDTDASMKRSFRRIVSEMYGEGRALIDRIRKTPPASCPMEEHRRWQNLTHSMLILLKDGNDKIMRLNEEGQSFPVVRGFRLSRQYPDIDGMKEI